MIDYIFLCSRQGIFARQAFLDTLLDDGTIFPPRRQPVGRIPQVDPLDVIGNELVGFSTRLKDSMGNGPSGWLSMKDVLRDDLLPIFARLDTLFEFSRDVAMVS